MALTLFKNLPRDEDKDNEFSLSQPWQTFACQVSPPTNPQPLTLHTALTPWRIYIDLTSIDSSDTFILQTLVKIHAPSSIPLYTKDEGGYIWLLEDKLVVNVRTPKPAEPPVIHINDNPISMFKILTIEPVSGPWIAKLTIAQVQGISKQLRFMCL